MFAKRLLATAIFATIVVLAIVVRLQYVEIIHLQQAKQLMVVKRMMFRGMHRHNGEGISDTAHLRQSAFGILQTPAGSRVMRRDYGSTLFTLIDQP